MSDTRVPSTPKASAPFIGWGLFLTVCGLPLVIGAAALAGSGDPEPFAWAGLLVVITGGALLAVGGFRWASHADRDAGVLAAYAPLPIADEASEATEGVSQVSAGAPAEKPTS